MRLYQLTLEDFTREFSSLPDKYKILLFKLQTSYCFKEEPLNEFEIAGIANAEIPLDENLLRFLNNYFVQTKEGLWKSPSVDSQSEQLENLIEKEVQKRVARALAGMKGGLKRVQNLKARSLPVQVEDDSDAIVGQAEMQQYPDEEAAFKQMSSKPQANSKQNPSKVVANSDFATAKESQLVDFQEKHKNLSNAPEFEPEACPSLTHVCASDNPINPISDNFLINKNKSESVSESVKEKTENFKNQNSREKFSAGKIWTLQEAQTLLADSGLDKKFLEAWVSRSDRNQTRFNALFSEVLPRFDQEAFDQLIARCKEQKRSEGAMFSGSIAYVISALERETVTVKTRRKKKNSERDYTEGLIQNPDGSWSPDPNYVPKKKKYSDRDWTEGLIKNPDGSYSLDPNYER